MITRHWSAALAPAALDALPAAAGTRPRTMDEQDGRVVSVDWITPHALTLSPVVRATDRPAAIPGKAVGMAGR